MSEVELRLRIERYVRELRSGAEILSPIEGRRNLRTAERLEAILKGTE